MTWQSTMGLGVVAVNESAVGVLFDGSCSEQLTISGVKAMNKTFTYFMGLPHQGSPLALS